MRCRAFVFLGLLTPLACGQTETYEGEIAPADDGWELRLAGTFGADLSFEEGFLVQAVDLPNAWPGPLGNAEFYRRSVMKFANEQAFFVEWRVETDASSAILDDHRVPVVLSAFGNGNALYHFTITQGRIVVVRHSTLPVVYVDIAPGIAHTYRLELYGDALYAWYIDGQLIDSGIPYGVYPREDSRIIWGSQYVVQELPVQTTRWDFVRYGVIPADGSGDFDSDGAVTEFDFYFFHECLTNERLGINGGPEMDSGPGCRFADFDSDADTDLRDFAEFQQLFERAF